MSSTSSAERRDARRRVAGARVVRTLGVVAFWLAVWQVVATVVDQAILLASPGAVLLRLGELVVTGPFWATVAHSLVRIAAGFGAAAVVGVLGAAAAAGWRWFDTLVSPLVAAVRTTPVVSFIILVLMWARADQLAFVISFLMVVPVMYTTALEGIRHRDVALLEVARVFAVPLRRRLAAVDVPAVLPYVVAGCQVGVGLAWKSGIAAEVIGLPAGSIGEQLYEAKLFLLSPDAFAWTLVIIAISAAFERLVVGVLGRGQRRLAGGTGAP